MSSTFTLVNTIDLSKERDWPASLGMLDWDSTSIVFTKRSLIEFLKYTGTTVDPNFTNIQKLPRYAKFGKISEESTDASVGSSDLQTVDSSEQTGSSDFKPSRRVRTVPGGPHSDIFGHHADEGDALSSAPPKPPSDSTTAHPPPKVAAIEAPVDEEYGIDFRSSFKPSRRVRTAPGGNTSLSNFWDPAETETFKPTRRVTQGPGGQDSINELF